MSGWSTEQIAQLIADHAALKDEVAALKGALAKEHEKAVEEMDDDWPVHLKRFPDCRLCRLAGVHGR